MMQFFFGLIAGLLIGLVMEWIVDWQLLTPGSGLAARRSQAQPREKTEDHTATQSSQQVPQNSSETAEPNGSAHGE